MKFRRSQEHGSQTKLFNHKIMNVVPCIKNDRNSFATEAYLTGARICIQDQGMRSRDLELRCWNTKAKLWRDALRREYKKL